MAARLWRVVGGGDKGGIIVREGKELSSAALELRLETGAIVREEERSGDRLHFSLEQGEGPVAGWISIKAGGNTLLERADKAPAGPGGVPAIALLDGRRMPALGLGVYRCQPGEETYNAVKWALEFGYRLVDTAAYYRNEESVGKAIRDSGIPREELWVTTKLPGHGHGYEDTIRLCETSLEKLGLDYIDLYLIHSPHPGKLVETWDAMVYLQKNGYIRSIGVSNFNKSHLVALRKHGRPMPTVNQIEMHPMIYKERKLLCDYCTEHGILVEAYGSVLSGHEDLLQSKIVSKVVAAHPSKTPAQVLLRWGFQQGFQLIPKSTRQPRIKENMDIFDFELSEKEMQLLNTMEGSLGEYWNPLNSPVDLGRTNIGSGGA